MTTRLAPESATYRLEAASTAIPSGLESVCADICEGRTATFIEGWPKTRIAEAPVPAPAWNSSTRLLPVSATNKSPLGPIARPAGEFKEDAFTAAETELVKSACPSTASGTTLPLWLTGRL